MEQKSKKVKVGNVIVEKKTNREGKEYTAMYVALGQKNPKNAQYNFSVEITVRDAAGQVIAKQTDGFISVEDPRKRPETLLAAGAISEDAAEKMRERAANIPARIKQELWVNRS